VLLSRRRSGAALSGRSLGLVRRSLGLVRRRSGAALSGRSWGRSDTSVGRRSLNGSVAVVRAGDDGSDESGGDEGTHLGYYWY
jgi:hypothetical protein